MTYRSYQKLSHYPHVSDRPSEPTWNSADYDKLYNIYPVLNMVQDSFAESYKPRKSQTTDKGMISFKDRLSYVHYLPTRLIKRVTKV